jgi:hypothetical protein
MMRCSKKSQLSAAVDSGFVPTLRGKYLCLRIAAIMSKA